MSNFVVAEIDRLESEDDLALPGRIRKRGIVKAAVGLLVFVAAFVAVVICQIVQLSLQDDPLRPDRPPTLWDSVLNQALALIVGIPMVIGLFAVVFGIQQVIFGKPWNKLPTAIRVLMLAICIPIVFAATAFAVFTVADLLAENPASTMRRGR